MGIKHAPFDFDYWRKLAEIDPKLFEIKRREVIEEAIDGSPEHLRERLRRLQWRIDAERARASNPLSASIRLNKMTMDEVLGKGGLLDSFFLLRDSILKLNRETVHGKIPLPQKKKVPYLSLVKK